MPSKERCLEAAVEEYLTYLSKRKRRAKVTVDGYRWLIGKVNRALLAAGMDAHPTRWTEDTVEYVLENVYQDSRPGVARREVSVLSTYLQHFGNTAIKSMELEWPQDERINVDWLSPEQAIRLTEAAEGIERIIIHLQLNIFMRRVEVLRLKVQDIGLGYINIRGKGRNGGKWRTNPFHPDTNAELAYYFRLREYEIAKARAKNPDVVVPDSLLIYERAGQLHAYKRSAVDKFVRRAGERIGVKLTNHTNRRTGLRACWLAGVPIETIRDLAGHEDTKTTILYIGINMDDKSGAMSQLAKYQAALSGAKTSEASVLSGQSGIPVHETIWLTPKMPRPRQR